MPQNRCRECCHCLSAVLFTKHGDAVSDQAAFHFVNRAAANGRECHLYFICGRGLPLDHGRQTKGKNCEAHQMSDTWLEHVLTSHRSHLRATGQWTHLSRSPEELACVLTAEICGLIRKAGLRRSAVDYNE